MLALFAIMVMIVGIFLYDYIPNSITIAKANSYQRDSDTQSVIDDTSAASSLLSSLTSQSSNSSGTSTTTIILDTYEVTSSDLSVYKSSGAYTNGKADPFSDPVVQSTDDETGSSGSTGGNSGSSVSSGSSSTSGTTTNSSSSQTSDGTLFNSTSKK
jgi:hypothetical protein